MLNNNLTKQIMVEIKSKLLAPLYISIVDYREEISIEKFRIRKRTSKELLKYYNIDNVIIRSGVIKYLTKSKNKQLGKTLYKDDFYLKDDNGLVCEYYITGKDLNSNDVELLLTAFRLFKCGVIYSDFIFNETLSNFSYIYPRCNKGISQYQITIEEMSDIESIYEKLKSVEANDKYKLIYERFNNSISVISHIKNSYIDLVGILESILIGNENSELSFRFSLYLAILLNDLGENVSFKDCKDIYNARSKLVHTGKCKNFKDSDFYELESYVRKVIIWYIDNHLGENLCKELLFEKLKMS